MKGYPSHSNSSIRHLRFVLLVGVAIIQRHFVFSTIYWALCTAGHLFFLRTIQLTIGRTSTCAIKLIVDCTHWKIIQMTLRQKNWCWAAGTTMMRGKVDKSNGKPDRLSELLCAFGIEERQWPPSVFINQRHLLHHITRTEVHCLHSNGGVLVPIGFLQCEF